MNLQLLDFNKNKIKLLTNIEDLRIERELNCKTSMFFNLDNKFSKDIKLEYYIRTKNEEFLIKEKANNEYRAVLNLEELEGKAFKHFEMINKTIDESIKTIVSATPYKIKSCNVTKRRTIRKSNCSALELIEEARKIYKCDITFNSIKKEINIYEKLGIDNGVYFIEDLNLEELEIDQNSYNFCTRLIPIGENGLNIKNINNGKEYIENYQYSNKIITKYWEDNRYTVVENLKEDAILKLKELSKPFISYKVNVLDLSKTDKKYKNLNFNLGDTITLISKENNIKEKQRIVKIIEYPNDTSLNTLEIANSFLTFANLQKEFKDTTDTVNTVTTSDNLIDSSKVDLKPIKQEFYCIISDKANIGDLNAIKANIGELNVNKADVTQLNAYYSKIQDLYSVKANIEDLKANNAKITTLESKAASIENLLNGNLGAENIKAGAITAGSGIIADGAIGDAQISNLSATKLTAGVLDASLIKVKNLNADEIITGKINGKIIENGAIDNSKIADNAKISGSKLDIDNVIFNINNSNTTIDSTKIKVGNKSLDVELKEQNIKEEKNNKAIEEQKLQINALQDSIKFKIDKQEYDKDKNTNKEEMNKQTARLDLLQDKISSSVSQEDIMKIFENENLLLASGYLQDEQEAFKYWYKEDQAVESQLKIYTSSNYKSIGVDIKRCSDYGICRLVNTSLKEKGFKFNVNKKYCLFGKIQASKNVDCINITVSDLSNNNNLYENIYSESDEFIDFKYVFEPKFLKDNLIKFSITFNQPQSNSYVWIPYVKLCEIDDNTDIDKLVWTGESQNKNAQYINKAKSEINQLKDGISLKVNSSDFSSYKNKINEITEETKSQLHSTQESINVLKGQISSKVSKTEIDKTIIDINEKNRNLIINSGDVKKDNLNYWKILMGGGATGDKYLRRFYTSTYSGIGGKVNNLNNGWYILTNTSLKEKGFKFNVNKKYCLFGKIDTEKDCSINIQIANDNNTNRVVQKRYNVTKDYYCDFEIIFEPKIEGDENNIRFQLETDDVKFWIPYVKLCEYIEGDNVWTPAPEDITLKNENKINSAETEINQLSDQINSKVDVNGVKSVIQQNPNSVKVGFNSITPNINLSNSGALEIYNGAIKVYNNNHEVVLDGSKKVFRVVKEGELLVDMKAGYYSQGATVKHNLGYIPTFICWQMSNSASSNPSAAILPTFELSLSGIENKASYGIGTICRAGADKNTLSVQIHRIGGATEQHKTYRFKYVIFDQQAF